MELYKTNLNQVNSRETRLKNRAITQQKSREKQINSSRGLVDLGLSQTQVVLKASSSRLRGRGSKRTIKSNLGANNNIPRGKFLTTTTSPRITRSKSRPNNDRSTNFQKNDLNLTDNSLSCGSKTTQSSRSCNNYRNKQISRPKANTRRMNNERYSSSSSSTASSSVSNQLDPDRLSVEQEQYKKSGLSRLDQLREWKKKRELLKLNSDKKKPMFKVTHVNYTNELCQLPPVSKLPASKKKAVAKENHPCNLATEKSEEKLESFAPDNFKFSYDSSTISKFLPKDMDYSLISPKSRRCSTPLPLVVTNKPNNKDKSPLLTIESLSPSSTTSAISESEVQKKSKTKEKDFTQSLSDISSHNSIAGSTELPKTSHNSTAHSADLNSSSAQTGKDKDGGEAEHGVPYFRNNVKSITDDFNLNSKYWNEVIENEKDSLSEEDLGQIRATIGQAALLTTDRFKQFSGLIDNCEFGTGDIHTSCTDLQGFWDMIDIQVSDVQRKFSNLVELKKNNWIRVVVSKKVSKKVPKKKPASTKPVVGKSKFAEYRANMKKQLKACEGETVVCTPKNTNTLKNDKDQMKVFDGGFFKIDSPISPHSSSKKSVLTPQNKSRLSRRSVCSPHLIAALNRSLRKSLSQSNNFVSNKENAESAAAMDTTEKSLRQKTLSTGFTPPVSKTLREAVDTDLMTFSPLEKSSVIKRQTRRSVRLSLLE